jgi:hypothetical protein
MKPRMIVAAVFWRLRSSAALDTGRYLKSNAT